MIVLLAPPCECRFGSAPPAEADGEDWQGRRPQRPFRRLIHYHYCCYYYYYHHYYYYYDQYDYHYYHYCYLYHY